MLRRGDVAHMELFFGLEIAIDDIYGNTFYRIRGNLFDLGH